ncbi:hypothetical protein Golax_020538 [Gossypium laxum]|uniref:RRM domain-containing protein n=1 Tax=Gossypium laxum TaxID=34288 RepID=A0A7J9B1B3_9ROSI|nr:hypothetical protein [Gossypium laxum]
MSAQEVLSALTGIYRHEMPETGELSQQNIKDCYYGGEFGWAVRLPAVSVKIAVADLRDNFAHGEIVSIKMVLNKACAFVTNTTREGAEKVAEELSNKPVIKGLRLKLMWGKPKAPKLESETSEGAKQPATVAHSGMLPRALISQQQN